MVAVNPWGSWLHGSSATQALAVVHHLTLLLLSGINMSDCQADFNPHLATDASRLWKWWRCLKNVLVRKVDTFFSMGDVICLRSSARQSSFSVLREKCRLPCLFRQVLFILTVLGYWLLK